MIGPIEQEDKRLTTPGQLQALVPSTFSLAITAEQAKAELAETTRNTDYTSSEAHRRIAQTMAPLSYREQVVRETRSFEIQRTTSGIISPEEMNLLEQYRIGRGLSERRESLMNALFSALTFDNGLRTLGMSLRKEGDTPYHTMEELNADYPHITKTEVVLMSLLQDPPADYVNYGKKHSNDPNTRLVPIIIGLGPNGLATALETLDLNRDAQEGGYAQLGITGKSEGVDFVPLREGYRKMVEEIVSLTISNYRLHERVWNVFDTAISQGLGIIDREAIRRACGLELDIPIADLKRSLTPTQYEDYKREASRIDRNFGKNIIVNSHTGQALSPSDMVKLIGLIDGMPKELFDEEKPFEGSFTPYGAGILLVQVTGEKRFYPYKAYYVREAMQGMYYEAVQSSETSRTFAEVYNLLLAQAENSVFHESQETGESPSILEGIKLDIKLEFGINLVVNPPFLIDETEMIDSMLPRHQGSALKKIDVIKMSADEARQIYEILRILPKELLKPIKQIRKLAATGQTLGAYMDGLKPAATYEDGVISIYEDPDFPYVNMDPKLRVAQGFALIHEIFHSLWRSMDPKEMDSWERISWGRDKDHEDESLDKTQYLTLYSHVLNPEEDFCDHGASYVLHGEEFRQKARDLPDLRRKYDAILAAVANSIGRPLEFPQISPFTIEEVHGAVDQELKRLSMEQAIEKIESDAASAEIRSRANRAAISVSLDEGKIDDVLAPEEQESAVSDDGSDIENYRLQKEKEIGLKREGINTIIDYVSESLDEDRALRISRRIFALMEEGEELSAILSIASRYVDEEYWDEFVEAIESIQGSWERRGKLE